MKRSEAVLLAQKYIDHNAGQIVGEQLIRFAETILGMEPPTLKTEDAKFDPDMADERWEQWGWEQE